MAQLTFDYTKPATRLRVPRQRPPGIMRKITLVAGLVLPLPLFVLLFVLADYRRQNHLLVRQNADLLLRYDSLLTAKLHADRQLLQFRLRPQETPPPGTQKAASQPPDF